MFHSRLLETHRQYVCPIIKQFLYPSQRYSFHLRPYPAVLKWQNTLCLLSLIRRLSSPGYKKSYSFLFIIVFSPSLLLLRLSFLQVKQRKFQNRLYWSVNYRLWIVHSNELREIYLSACKKFAWKILRVFFSSFSHYAFQIHFSCSDTFRLPCHDRTIKICKTRTIPRLVIFWSTYFWPKYESLCRMNWTKIEIQ